MDFLYSFVLKLLYPSCLASVLLVASAVFSNRKKIKWGCFWGALAVLLVCGNGWVVRGLTVHLERQYLPHGSVPEADCILVLSGGTLPKLAPRTTVEMDDAGDRVLYAGYLFRQGRAPFVICTGNVATGGIAPRSAAEDMAELLEFLAVPKDAIITETKAENTHQHGVNLLPLLRERGFKRILLVTSAMHMPRSMGVFRKSCPGIEFISAPTDFHAPDRLPGAWHRELTALFPTPRNLCEFSEVMHEYLGLWYYRLRGWI
jgi:uncharacterized SAM-binding protein YcdF (DUF218 family)